MPPAGVELATFSLGRSYSIQLSYGGVGVYFSKFGGAIQMLTQNRLDLTIRAYL